MALRRTVSPAAEPVTPEECKDWMRLDQDLSEHDEMIQSLIVAAREQAEKFLRASLITQTWQLTLDGFPSGVIRLPQGPVQSVQSVSYIDSNGDSQVWADFQTDLDSTPPRIIPPVDDVYPDTEVGRLNSVTVTYVAGYGAPKDVPDTIKSSIKSLVSFWYDNPGAMAQEKLPLSVASALWGHRRWLTA